MANTPPSDPLISVSQPQHEMATEGSAWPQAVPPLMTNQQHTEFYAETESDVETLMLQLPKPDLQAWRKIGLDQDLATTTDIAIYLVNL